MTLLNKQLRVCHASFSKIDSDQRIIKEISTLRDSGYEVVSVGYGVGVVGGKNSFKEKIIRTCRQIPANIFGIRIVTWLYWQNPECKCVYQEILKSNANIIHAHDWEVLPAAADAAKHLNAKLIYDSHEVASEMRAHRLIWRIVFGAFIKKLETEFIHRADRIITVGEYCAGYLNRTYGLRKEPEILNNYPVFQELKLQETDYNNIVLHYHGILTSGRGLTSIVKLLAMLPERFKLRITGLENQKYYRQNLLKLARSLDCHQRIEINEPVPFKRLLHHSNEADIGVFIPELTTEHQAAAAPNKFYEYMMSGLMLVTNESLEAKRLINNFDVGLIATSGNLDKTARMLTSLTAAQIDRFKANSLQAAKRLCWESEQLKLNNIYRSLS